MSGADETRQPGQMPDAWTNDGQGGLQGMAMSAAQQAAGQLSGMYIRLSAASFPKHREQQQREPQLKEEINDRR